LALRLSRGLEVSRQLDCALKRAERQPIDLTVFPRGLLHSERDNLIDFK
jgi:hypothetical protein